jgi:hypothetical protein
MQQQQQHRAQTGPGIREGPHHERKLSYVEAGVCGLGVGVCGCRWVFVGVLLCTCASSLDMHARNCNLAYMHQAYLYVPTLMCMHACTHTHAQTQTQARTRKRTHTHTRTHAHTQAPLRKGSTTWGEAQGRPGSERRCVCVSQCVCMCFARAYEFAKAVQWTLLFLETGVCAAHYYSKHKRLQAYVHTYTHTCTHFCKH